MVTNFGSEMCSGDGQVSLGLSYDQSWIPERQTQFHSFALGNMQLAPGEHAVITIDVPSVPTWALSVLRERLTVWWTGYQDKDPESDYIGVIFLIGDDTAYGFLPLAWHCPKADDQ